MVIAPYAIVFAVLGALMLAAVPEKFPTVREFGKAMMYAGLFAFAFAMAHKTFALFDSGVTSTSSHPFRD